MKAIVFESYGAADVLSLADVAEPEVGAGDVLVRVRAASVNPLDWHFMTGLPYLARIQFGWRRPKVTRIGADLSGVIERVGASGKRFRPGDEVFGSVADASLPELGSCAEFVRVPEDLVVSKPDNLTFEQAAAVPTAGLTALQGLRDQGQIRAGQHVLIHGASGGVGTFAVQIAKSFGAEVTGVCGPRHVAMVRSIGADHVVDYTAQDFTRDGRRYDLMLDNVGDRPLSACRRILRRDATYVASFGRAENRWLGPASRLLGLAVQRPFVSQKMVTWVATPRRADLLLLRELLESGQVASVVAATYPLAETPRAMRHLATGHTSGKIVISVGANREEVERDWSPCEELALERRAGVQGQS